MTQPPITRRRMLGATAALGLLPAAARAQPQRPATALQPGRPVTLWLPWPPGGATDMVMRHLAELAGTHLKHRIQIDNRPGAGGTLVMPVLQQAEPDGHTIAQLPQPVLRVPWAQKVLWDPVRDTTPIIRISGVTFGILVPAASAFRTLEDLFTYARRHPGELSIATNGVGTTPHVVLEELFTARGLKYNHIPYKGSFEQVLAVEQGQVMAGVNSNGYAPSVEGGRQRLLAVMSAQRSARFPKVPTLTELGLPIVANSPWGLVGPRGLSPALVQLLHDAFRAAMQDPVFAAELARFDQELDYQGPAEYGQWLKAEYQREKLAVERMGLAKGG